MLEHMCVLSVLPACAVLASAAKFGTLGYSLVSNFGHTTVDGMVGVYPGKLHICYKFASVLDYVCLS